MARATNRATGNCIMSTVFDLKLVDNNIADKVNTIRGKAFSNAADGLCAISAAGTTMLVSGGS